MKMKSTSRPSHPFTTFFKYISAICASICLFIAVVLYVYPTASVAKPIYEIMMKDIKLTNYILCILILCSIGALVLSFILSFFTKKEVAAENSKILDTLTEQQVACAETTDKSILTLAERMEKIEGRIEKADRIVERNCDRIQINLKDAERKVSFFQVQQKRNLFYPLKRGVRGTDGISKKEVLDALKETEKLVEKYQDEIRSQ